MSARMTTAIVGALLLAAPLTAQELPPNAPKFVKTLRAPGLEVRFLDFRWDEALFDAMENGGSHPAAQRSWVLARLTLQTDPLRWNEKLIPVGPALLVLNPRRGTAGPTLDIRYIDMRDVFVNMNVVAEPPATEVYKSVPAVFAKVADTAPLFQLGLKEKGGVYELTVHYGNRQTVVTLKR